MSRIAVLFFVLALAGCSQPITGNIAHDVISAENAPTTPISATPPSAVIDTSTSLGQKIVLDLQSASFDADNAVTVGALPTTDPVPACLHDALTKLGVDTGQPAPPSFNPKNDGLISGAVILYIRAQQLKALQGGAGTLIAGSCQQIVGKLVFDLLAAQTKALSFGQAPVILRTQ